MAAGLAAALVSGTPSTAYALLTGKDPFEAVWAAGSLLLGAERRRGRLLAAAVAAHLAVSSGWALPLLPQLADHVTYGATVAAVLAARRKRRIEVGPTKGGACFTITVPGSRESG